MKNWCIALLMTCLLPWSQPVQAQTEAKLLKKELRRMAKEGWQPAYGSAPLADQLAALTERRLACTDTGSPVYLIGRGLAEGHLASRDYNLSYRRAEEMARTDLASQVQAQVNSTVSIDADSGDSSQQALSRVNSALRLLRDDEEVVAQFFRQRSDGRCEVLMYIALKRDRINEITKTL